MFLSKAGCLRKLLSMQTLPILQNQTTKLCPLQCHLLWGSPFHIICVLQPPGSGAPSESRTGYVVVKCGHQTAQQTRNWSGHIGAVSDAWCLQASREHRSVSCSLCESPVASKQHLKSLLFLENSATSQEPVTRVIFAAWASTKNE